jgi:hypothetical protein
LYDDELREWTRYDRSFRVNGPGGRIESLWLNPAAEDAKGRPHLDERRRAKRRPQLALFEGSGSNE